MRYTFFWTTNGFPFSNLPFFLQKFASGSDGITDALFLQVYSDLMLAEHMAEKKE